jgi:hypothetical protein
MKDREEMRRANEGVMVGRCGMGCHAPVTKADPNHTTEILCLPSAVDYHNADCAVGT